MNINNVFKNDNTHFQEVEERINQWLEDNSIIMVNPIDKMNDYFTTRKRQFSETSSDYLQQMNSTSDDIQISSFDYQSKLSLCMNENRKSQSFTFFSAIDEIDDDEEEGKTRNTGVQLKMIQSQLLRRRKTVSSDTITHII